MSVRKQAHLLRHGWCVNAAGLFIMAALALVTGTGLACAFGEQPASPSSVPLAAPSGALDPAVWTTPLGSLSPFRISDGRQRFGQLLALALPRADRAVTATAGATAAIVALILLRLLARRDHGVRAPPFRPIPVAGASQHRVRRLRG